MSGYGGTGGFGAHLSARLGDHAAAPPALVARAQAAFGTVGFAGLLAPSTPAAVAEALALCSAEGWPVVPLGAASWPVGSPGTTARSAESRRPPVLLSTARLDRITEHEPADLVIGVQAGLPLRRLDQTLGASRQWLPLDPPAAIDATIGAVAALGAAGPLRAGHGTPRDMALGVEIATGDGRLLRFGGRVVKNVAGYDGVRLVIGSRGTLGIITGIFLRVRGTPRADRTLALACGAGLDGFRRGAELALAMRDRVACDALELISPAIAGKLSRTPRDAGWTLLVRVLGGTAAVDDALDRLHTLAGTTGGTRQMTEVPTAIWTALGHLEADAHTAVRLTGPVTTLQAGLQAAAGETPRHPDIAGDGWLIAAHAADGVIRMWRRTGARAPDDEPAQSVERLAAASATAGWTMTCDTIAEGGPADAGGPADPGRPAVDRAKSPAGADTRPDQPQPDGPDQVRTLTRRLRHVFDPVGILSGSTEWL